MTVLTVTVNPKTFEEDYDGFVKLLETLNKLKLNATCDFNEKAVNKFSEESKTRTALKQFDDVRTPNSVYSKAS